MKKFTGDLHYSTIDYKEFYKVTMTIYSNLNVLVVLESSNSKEKIELRGEIGAFTRYTIDGTPCVGEIIVWSPEWRNTLTIHTSSTEGIWYGEWKVAQDNETWLVKLDIDQVDID
jgi:hypothetical protein